MRKRSKKGMIKKHLLVFLLFLIVLLFGYLYFDSKNSLWDGEEMPLVFPKRDESTEIFVFNPSSESLTKINVPKETQVMASKNLGTWRLKSILKLGRNENRGERSFSTPEEFLSMTIMKTFGVPIFAWGDQNFENLSERNILSNFLILNPLIRTNLTLKDKMLMVFFMLSLKNTSVLTIDLLKEGIISKAKLVDGDVGFLVGDVNSAKVKSLFSDSGISKSSVNVEIINQSSAGQNSYLINTVVSILESLGVKVVSIKTGEQSTNLDCNVSGKGETVVKISRVFRCKREMLDSTHGDIKLLLGEKFAKRF